MSITTVNTINMVLTIVVLVAVVTALWLMWRGAAKDPDAFGRYNAYPDSPPLRTPYHDRPPLRQGERIYFVRDHHPFDKVWGRVATDQDSRGYVNILVDGRAGLWLKHAAYCFRPGEIPDDTDQ